MTIEMIKNNVLTIVNDYPIKRITLFGSRAAGTDREDSDVDLIMEFSLPISLLTLSMIKVKLEEILEVGVDIVHGPIEESDLLEIGKVVELYAA
ncbi:MAG: nucleotidyltransferase domain-containing protein [Clostridium sp.]|nr:nucleotidyltransferase domain-containing protein [Acetatifactor muris]MCM1526328.1 nucleotidyltransferase domain-containing protein [Bacteroides sp.]MCM1562855.1 nucleotidyltransferase domain-containing protein [Clostridium sp.]